MNEIMGLAIVVALVGIIVAIGGLNKTLQEILKRKQPKAKAVRKK